MSQSVKRLLCKDKDLSLISSAHIKKQSVTAHSYNARAKEAEEAGSLVLAGHLISCICEIQVQ